MKDGRLELAIDGALEPAGVGMADMVKACLVKTDIVVGFVAVKKCISDAMDGIDEVLKIKTRY